MQTRLLVIAALVLALLAGYVWWSGSHDDDDGDPPLDEGEVALFADLEVDQVIRLTLGTDGKQVILERQGELDWLVAGEPARPADDALAEAAARAAISITSTRQLGSDAGSPADFGLGDDAFGLTLETGDGSSHSLRVGDRAPVGGGRYLLDVDSGAMHLVDGWSLGPLERDPADFRDRRLVPLDPDTLTEVRVARADLPELVLERPGRLWFIRAEPAWRAEAGLVRDLLVDLAELRARDYLGPVPPKDDFAAELEIQILDADGRSAALLLGGRDPDGLREARTSGELLPDLAGERARVAAPFLDELDPDPVVWRTYELLDFNPWVVETIEHSAGGRTWRLEQRDGGWVRTGSDDDVPLDAEQVQDLLNRLDGLRAVAYAPTDLELDEAGIQQARIELVQVGGEGVGLVLYRGPNRDYVQVDGEPGLKEVDGSVHALIGHLRPMEASDPEPASPAGEPEP